MVNTMNKNTIYKTAYETIEDSIEWADDEENYSTYILGIIEMTNKLLEKLDENKSVSEE